MFPGVFLSGEPEKICAIAGLWIEDCVNNLMPIRDLYATGTPAKSKECMGGRSNYCAFRFLAYVVKCGVAWNLFDHLVGDIRVACRFFRSWCASFGCRATCQKRLPSGYPRR